MAPDTPFAPATLHVSHIDASIELQPHTTPPHLAGRATISGSLAPQGGSLTLDAIDFTRHAISATPTPTRMQYVDAHHMIIEWPASTHSTFTLVIDYEASPQKGMPHTAQDIWTTFHTWHWLPVEQSPGQRATLNLDVHIKEPGWTITPTTFTQKTPHPAYTYGFHATQRTDTLTTRRTHGEDELVVLGTPHHERVLDHTASALTRWKSIFGDDWAPQTYTQAFVPHRAMQEAAGLSFLSMSHAEGLEAHPEEDWLIVHELAHQEWGNLVTCHSWGDFWINEAFAVWWVYRDKALRGDTESAERELVLWEARTRDALARGDDPRIHRPDSTHQNAGGSIVYNAGALVLHGMFLELGAERFERTLRTLVHKARTERGLSLTTSQFLDAFDMSAAQRAHVNASLHDAHTLLK